ncbi:hypothetical protein TNCV_1264361 [Trichonephila clavipes]|nr:hypothetical protein TNCV_1264361 [Trichonephila clavipes]
MDITLSKKYDYQISSVYTGVASSEWALYQNSIGVFCGNGNFISGTVVTHVGEHVASGPRIIDTADTVVATPLLNKENLLVPCTFKRSFAKREKGVNRLISGPDYMVDALKLSKQAPRISDKSLQTCVAWRCPDGIDLFCWPILAISGQSLASNGPVVNSRDLNLVFCHTEATHNKLFLSSPAKYTVEPSWMLVLIWPPFELLHHALTTIVFAQYCRMLLISHSQSPYA